MTTREQREEWKRLAERATRWPDALAIGPTAVDDLAEAALALLADVERLEAALDETGDALTTLRDEIEESLPAYVLDDGTDDPANPQETVEYAGAELARLRAWEARAREAMADVMAEPRIDGVLVRAKVAAVLAEKP